MDADTVFVLDSVAERDDVERYSLCASCHQQSCLAAMVAELLLKNQLLRFKLVQSEELVCQLRITCDQMQRRREPVAQEGEMSSFSGMVMPELEVGVTMTTSSAATLPYCQTLSNHTAS